jgi:hypothetical protein
LENAFDPLASELSSRYYSAYLQTDDVRVGVRKTKVAFVDLSLSETELWSSLRKSYKSLINWGRRNLALELVDQSNADPEVFVRFHSFHREVAGRETRTQETWDIQFDMVAAGEAYCVMGRMGERLVSANFVQLSGIPYYGVGVYDRTLMAEGMALAHWPLYFAILHAKKLGFPKFLLGDVGEGHSSKENSIAYFKRGFATDIVDGGWPEMSHG